MSEVRIAAAYIRVSTEDQAEYSPDAQLVEIRKYAARSNFVIPESLVFVDEGISGKKTAKRDAFNRMIGMAKQKPRPFDAILLWKFSRFARNREDSVVYKSMLRKQLGIEVISTSEPVGDDKMSILIEALIEAMDEYYSINLAEEVKRGMTEKARRGGLQATPPFGYQARDNLLVAIPEEAELVRAIFARFLDGEGLFAIAKWLNELGVTTKRGGRFENRTVEYILRNPAYIGKLRWNPTGRTRRDFDNENIILSDGGHVPLISMEIWDAAQKRMAQVKAQWRYHGRPSTEHRDWLSGMIRCAACGRTLLFTKPHYWKCGGYTKGACKHSQHTADERMKNMLLAVMTHDALSDVPLSCTLLREQPEQLDEAAILKEQIEQLDKKLLRLREAYLSGIESLESYSQTKAVLEAQQTAAQDRLEESIKPPAEVEPSALLKQGILDCVKLLESPDASQEEKHRQLQNMVDHATYSKENNRMTLTYRLL